MISTGEHVLVACASGGVGSAVVQLAKRRQAVVTAIAGREMMAQVGKMVWVSTPLFLIMFLLGAWRYCTLDTARDLAPVGAWVLLLLTMTAYWLYSVLADDVIGNLRNTMRKRGIG